MQKKVCNGTNSFGEMISECDEVGAILPVCMGGELALHQAPIKEARL